MRRDPEAAACAIELYHSEHIRFAEFDFWSQRLSIQNPDLRVMAPPVAKYMARPNRMERDIYRVQFGPEDCTL